MYITNLENIIDFENIGNFHFIPDGHDRIVDFKVSTLSSIFIQNNYTIGQNGLFS
jgi:hypothetical protein